MIRIISFSYKHQGEPEDVDVVLDCRNLPNPHSVFSLRDLTGKDKAVQDFLWKAGGTPLLLSMGEKAARRGQSVAFGCYGGRHRSVALAELLKDKLSDFNIQAKVEHRAL
ncbi:ATPase domain-containing protein [Rhizobium phage RHph_TM16]|nr:ATPase domain-containing protein [Rhizobium phage RHph_TM16]